MNIEGKNTWITKGSKEIDIDKSYEKNGIKENSTIVIHEKLLGGKKKDKEKTHWEIKQMIKRTC